jgi:NADH-quinone oxidoreductase subunit I
MAHAHDDDHEHDAHGHGAAHAAAPALPEGVRLAPGSHQQTFLEKVYLVEIAKGLGNTFRHLFTKTFTVDYDGTERHNPRKFHIPRDNYRGEHYLKKDENGHVKCVACFMCAAACPAECIHIEAEDVEGIWENRERAPKRFEIDMLRCIYCGMCEEACPVDAIALSTTYNVVSDSREAKVYDMDKLLRRGEDLGLSLTRHHYRPDGIPGQAAVTLDHH